MTNSTDNAAGATVSGTATTTLTGSDPMVEMLHRIRFEWEVAEIIIHKEQVSSINVLAELNDDACDNIIKGIRKMQRPNNNLEPYLITYLMARNFQTAVFMAKHYNRISPVLRTNRRWITCAKHIQMD